MVMEDLFFEKVVFKRDLKDRRSELGKGDWQGERHFIRAACAKVLLWESDTYAVSPASNKS